VSVYSKFSQSLGYFITCFKKHNFFSFHGKEARLALINVATAYNNLSVPKSLKANFSPQFL